MFRTKVGQRRAKKASRREARGGTIDCEVLGSAYPHVVVVGISSGEDVVMGHGRALSLLRALAHGTSAKGVGRPPDNKEADHP